MLVKAIRMGYYDLKRRREGAVFNLNDPKHFSKNWMEKIDGDNRQAKPIKPDIAEKVLDEENEDVI